LSLERLVMPRGPQGQKRPADVIGTAITVAKIATGEIKETKTTPCENPAALAVGGAGDHGAGRPGLTSSLPMSGIE
jgi:hypothetical protein